MRLIDWCFTPPRLAACALAAFFAGASPASADPFISGVYSSEEGCPSADIHSKGEPTLIREGNLEAIEYYCEFVEVRSVFDGRGWLIDAVCNEPGFFFPQQMVVMAEESDGAGPTVLRMSDGGGAEHQDNRFHRCPADG